MTSADEPLFTSVQATWNLLEPSAGAALAEAADAGARVIVKEAVANGRLTPASAGDQPGRPGRGSRPSWGRGGPAGLAAALAQPWAWRVLSGAVTPSSWTSNVAAERVELPAECSTSSPPWPTAAEYWATRSSGPGPSPGSDPGHESKPSPIRSRVRIRACAALPVVRPVQRPAGELDPGRRDRFRRERDGLVRTMLSRVRGGRLPAAGPA